MGGFRWTPENVDEFNARMGRLREDAKVSTHLIEPSRQSVTMKAKRDAKPDPYAPLVAAMLQAGLPEPVRELRFCERRWRFDFAWKARKVAIEIEGGIWTQGRHTRGAGMEGDMEKYNRAALLGWRVLRYSTGQIKAGAYLEDLRKALRA